MHPLVRVVLLVLLALLPSACEQEPCPERLRLDVLLEGGIPVCLGGSYSQVSAYSELGQYDSSGWFSMKTDSASYLYGPGGGVDLLVARPFAELRRGCASFRSEPDKAIELGQRIMARLGGEWRRVEGPRGVPLWRSQEGLEVSLPPPGACVKIRPAEPES